MGSAEFKGQDYLNVREPFSFIVKHGPWQVFKPSSGGGDGQAVSI